MARQLKELQIDTGIISPSVASEITGHARTTIRNWTKNGILKPIKLTGAGESRISALELMKVLIADCWPFERNLAVAAVNFSRRYQYDHLAYSQEVLKSFGFITPEQRKEIKFVANLPESIEFDAAGNVATLKPIKDAPADSTTDFTIKTKPSNQQPPEKETLTNAALDKP